MWWAVGNSTEIVEILDRDIGVYVFTDDIYIMDYEGNPEKSTAGLWGSSALGQIGLTGFPGIATPTNLTNLGQEVRDTLRRKPYIPQMSNLSYSRTGNSWVGRPISLTTTDPSSSSGQSYATAFATAPMEFSFEPLWNYREFLQHKDTKFPSMVKSQPKRTDNTPAGNFRQPLVAVHCNESLEEEKSHTPIGGNVARFSFFGSSFHKENFSLELSLDGKELMSLQTAGISDDLPVTIFPDLQDKVPVPITAAVVLRNDMDRFTMNYSPITLCLMQARWVEADVWMDVKEPHTFVQLETPFSDVAGFLSETSTHENVIKMGSEWLETVYDLSDGRNGTWPASAVQPMMRLLTSYPSTQIPAILSVFLVDFLTSPGAVMSWSSTFKGFESLPPSSKVRTVDVIYYKHRYGYKFHGSVSIPLAFSLLFIQLIIAIVHTALLIHKSPPHGRTCDTLGETVALTLTSKATGKSLHVEENMNNSQVWSMRVAVKGNNDERGHEMVAII
jgi:hypothetical protein